MENTCARVSFFNEVVGLRPASLTLAQVCSSEICGIFKNNFFTEQLRTTASTQLFGERGDFIWITKLSWACYTQSVSNPINSSLFSWYVIYIALNISTFFFLLLLLLLFLKEILTHSNFLILVLHFNDSLFWLSNLCFLFMYFIKAK